MLAPKSSNTRKHPISPTTHDFMSGVKPTTNGQPKIIVQIASQYVCTYAVVVF